ncbi:MAG TPA: dihydroorotate dehydrogenase (quinone) [Rhodospirillaceae bacterium]|nr:dihydroorotate dehydrogenase (quinone) [Rhodospirillaceae bacterium]MBL25379.1 dihydroorotate dehydrogenase (quinone) [Rhodospirillaceae bacterium]HAA93954.1 dihydroorotate dehydrogenase (quinone) [Rhodospirillaceae bacterium]HAT34248.1 dihydroorotate dehydrogenase (quinone) [Rhodospirillaceae bacterium]
MNLSRALLPLLHRLTPERAHRLTLLGLRTGLGPRVTAPDPPSLATEVAGLSFPNPIGIAAGFDKDAEVFTAMLNAGFGFAETGTVTPKPQAGNPKPRVFRLPEDKAVINRLGFNNGGLDAYADRLAARDQTAGIVGANIGRNKDSESAVADYVVGAKRVAPICDYLTINVSSPNTPGLRALQSKEALSELIVAVQKAVADANAAPPLFVKIAPDLTDQDKDDIAEISLTSGIAGLIVSNTTVERPDTLQASHSSEEGGLSGAPLFAPSTALLAEMYLRCQERLPLIGVGGIASGEDAYRKIRSGASLVQLYTALVYQGPTLIEAIKRDLAALLERDGFSNVADAVGIDAN